VPNATDIIVADAEFLSFLPDIGLSSPIGQAVAALCAAKRLVTTVDAKRHAESAYQAVVNSSLYQTIPAEPTSRIRRAMAKTLANQAPAKLMTRHAGITELIVVAAALEKQAGIVTSGSGHSYYTNFSPPLGLYVFVQSDLPNLV